MVFLFCISCWVFMDLGCPQVVVIVFWVVFLVCYVYEGVHFSTYSKYIKVREFEDL